MRAVRLSPAIVIATVVAGLCGPAAAQRTDGLAPDRTEWTLFPSLSYSVDDGFGFGALALIARFEEGWEPYRARIAIQAAASVREGLNGEVEFPSHNDFIEADLPGLADGTFRLRVRAAFQRNLAGWRGLGNNPGMVTEKTTRAGRYWRTFPSALVEAKFPLRKDLYVRARTGFLWNHTETFAGSRLERDMPLGVHSHGSFSVGALLGWDTRDHEQFPIEGGHIILGADGHLEATGSFGWATSAARARGYWGVAGEFLVLAGRLEIDLAFGDVPFYGLPNLGGDVTIRGIPQGFYYGQVRFLSTFEARSLFWEFDLFGLHQHVGAVAYVDAGRVFAGLSSNPALDGEGPGIRFGVGGGLRMLWGEAILIRLDVAWSPDGLGVYFGVNPTF